MEMKELFPMIPASAKALWFFGAILLFLLALFGLFSYIAYSSRSVEFELSKAGLRIRGGLYARMIPAGSLISAESRQIDLLEATSYKPRVRTNGIGLPGYAAGWFRLRNGEKALLFVTDQSSVVYVATREGYSVLMSVEEPETFLQSLRNVAANED